MKYRIKENVRKDGESWFQIQYYISWLSGWHNRRSRPNDINFFSDLKEAETELKKLRDAVIVDIKHHYS